MKTIYFEHKICLIGFYEANSGGFQQHNQPILMYLFDDTTKLMLLRALSIQKLQF